MINSDSSPGKVGLCCKCCTYFCPSTLLLEKPTDAGDDDDDDDGDDGGDGGDGCDYGDDDGAYDEADDDGQ